MEKILEKENLQAALGKVISNKGAPGLDGITADKLSAYLKANWQKIKGEIVCGKYKPSPVKRVEIPKASGGVRYLGIPNTTDRFIQQAILQVLTPIFDPKFSDKSFGFRPGKRAHDAVRLAKSYFASGCTVVVDMDIEKFFDNVNQDILMSRLARYVGDKEVLRLIRKYLQSGVMLNGVCILTDKGTPQGSPLSPLLANILLDDLDKELERRRHKFVRYADDCNIYVKSLKAGERVMASITAYLDKKLKLKVNREKSAVGSPVRRKFLGFSMVKARDNIKIRISNESIKRVKDKIRMYTDPTWSISIEERIKCLNRYLTGWLGYYSLTEAKSILKKLTSWMRRRMRLCQWHNWKRIRTKYRNLVKLGVKPDKAYVFANSSRREWKSSASTAIHIALGIEYWSKLGLIDLLEKYQQIIIRQNR